MTHAHTPESLIAFEDAVAAAFAERRVRAPVHLSGGNERQLIDIFRQRVGPDDWVCTTWRSHYHCLLRGVPPAELMQAILDGRSMNLCFPERRIVSSAIVGQIAPIAVGLALAIRRKRENHRRKVVCFLGDMAAESGIAQESIKYAGNHYLPMLWFIEDNGMSIDTRTREAWGGPPKPPGLVRYSYKLTRPPKGIGRHVEF